MLTSRDLPLPLKAQFVDDEGHKGSVVVGRIDEVYRDGGLIKAAGVWDITPEADRAWGMIDRKMWRGVSVDLDAAEGEMVEAAEEGGQPSIEFTQGRVCSSTLCAIPAFAEAFIRNGTWAEFANEPMPSGAMVEIPDWAGVDGAQAEVTPALSLVAAAVADITVFEDEWGVAFSGRIRPWATEQQIHELFAAGPSGDWRGVRYRGRDSMELVAAHAVNVPGFPVVRPRFAMDGTRQVSLVAAGMIHNRQAEVDAVFADLREMRAVDVFNEITTLKGL
jgi:hypothetical protein